MKQRDLNDTLIFWHRLQMFKFANNVTGTVVDILIWENKVRKVGSVMFVQVQELSIRLCPKFVYLTWVIACGGLLSPPLIS